jgi:hypothetical protein
MKSAGVALLGFALFSSPALAGPITLGVFSPVPVSNADNQPFWDGRSYDGLLCTGGTLVGSNGLTGSNGCPGTPDSLNLANLEYLNDGAGNAVQFTFADALSTFDFKFAISSSGGDKLSWFNPTNSNTGVLFDYPTEFPEKIKTVAHDPTIGFRFETLANGASQTYDTNGVGFDQFALFRSGNTYILAIEDLRRFTAGIGTCPSLQPGSDCDYNDMLVIFSESPVVSTLSTPEPASITLFGSALVYLVRFRQGCKRTNRRTGR